MGALHPGGGPIERQMPAIDDDAGARSALAPREPLRRYLRALWSTPFPLQYGEHSPFIVGHTIHLPARHPAANGAAAWRWYRAAAAHAAAHLAYSPPVFDGRGLAPIARALLGLLEDARVESLASRELPGLRRLWAALHTASPADGSGFEPLMLRLARVLIDPAYDDPHPWVRKGRQLFFVDKAMQILALRRPDELRRAATLLGNDIGQMRLPFNARLYVPGPDYRDDQRWMWPAPQASDPAFGEPVALPTPPRGEPLAAAPPHRESVPPVPPHDGPVVPVPPHDGPVVPVPPHDGPVVPAPPRGRHTDSADFFASGASSDTGPGDDPVALPAELYPEWDRLIARLRPRWCAVIEQRVEQNATAPAPVDLTAHPLRAPMRRALSEGAPPDAARPEPSHDGDRLDADALVRARVAQRLRQGGEVRVHLRAGRDRSPGRAVVLIDQSASSADAWGRTGLTLLRASCEVGALVTDAWQAAGVKVALCGFCSNGRHDVRLRLVKPFARALDAAALCRLAALRSQHSTRLGAAIRHATRRLDAGPRHGPRDVVLITDGRPHDVDVHDPRYLPDDARQAILQAARRGVRVACIVLDAGAAPLARRIFGARHVAVLDRLDHLPRAARRLGL